MTTVDLAIKNGRIVTAEGEFEGDVYIRGGRIAGVGHLLHGSIPSIRRACNDAPDTIIKDNVQVSRLLTPDKPSQIAIPGYANLYSEIQIYAAS